MEQTGVIEWVNAYRSGDYVGRWLWNPDEGDQFFQADAKVEYGPWLARPGLPQKNSTDKCIGAGAHTHYWDKTAKAIALELDRMIAS